MDYQRIESLFYAALDKNSCERHDYVSRMSGHDPDLESAVLRLLQCHEKNLESGFVMDSYLALSDCESGRSLFQEEDLSGEVIDRYRLLEKIGEGGMGVVYMAEQILGIKRKVAVKVVRPGMDGRQVVARFEIERQALAMFDHHAIAKVFDSGSTSDGRPYFVMELVRGISITDYAKQHNMSLTQRIELFVTVCEAVQHAHQKGIIHRDLKPANIMVTRVDEKPQVKIIDFGIAKALEDRLTDATCYTRYASIIGTPQYMSPEQADANSIDVDTRSDVYALGVVLYELLTGNTPIAESEFAGLTPLQQLETIRQFAEITPPSITISIPKPPAHEPQTRSIRMSGSSIRDLDAIVLKALAMCRIERYQSASGFAEDLRRCLEGLPVEAAPPSRMYKLRKLLRRHRRTFVSLLAISSTLVVSSCICIAYAIDAWRANKSKDQTLAELKSLNSALQKKNEKLKAAQDTIKQNSTVRIKTFAFEKSMRSFQQIVWGRVSHLFPRYMLNANSDVEDATGLKKYMQVFPAEINYIQHLFDLGNRELLNDELQILDKIAKEMTPTGHKRVGPPEDELMPDVAAEVFNEVGKIRYRFFELLCDNYKAMFGRKDPRVCEALNIYACSLIESNKWERAKLVANESLELSEQDATRETATRILNFIEENIARSNGTGDHD